MDLMDLLYALVGLGFFALVIYLFVSRIVDIRPAAFDRDQAAVSTLDGRTALYSVAGKTQIQDVRKAIYCARNSHQAALAKTVATVRRMLNGYDSEDIRFHTQTVCDNITQAICDSMGELGMAVSDFRLNQLRILEAVSRTTRNSSGASV